MDKTCYRCEAPGTTHEHVPPKCFFPVLSDSPEGDNPRKNRITVPSCESHTLDESDGDEYFFFVLAACHRASPVGRRQAETRLARAFRQAPSLLQKFIPRSHPAGIKNAQGWLKTE